MKKTLLLLPIFFSFPLQGLAQEYYWTGGPFGERASSPMSICTTYNAGRIVGGAATDTRLVPDENDERRLHCQTLLNGPVIPSLKNTWVGAFRVVLVGNECPADKHYDSALRTCIDREPYPKKSCEVANPVDISNGAKVQREIDLENAFGPGKHFVRIFRSKMEAPKTKGMWHMPFSRKVVMTEWLGDSYLRVVNAVRDDGSEYIFRRDEETGKYYTDSDSRLLLEEEVDDNDRPLKFRFIADDVIEEYSNVGKLIKVSDYQGVMYEIEPGPTRVITSRNGQSLTFSKYSSGLIENIQHSDGRRIFYTYNNSGLIETVSLFQTPNVDEEAQYIKTYHYENTDYPTLLTGITDESNTRYATWDYDEYGRAILSEHAGGSDRYTFAYPDALTTRVTNPLGKVTSYEFENYVGYERIKSVTGFASENCLASNQAYSYNDQGLLSESVDRVGTVIGYEYNDRGLMTKTIEAKGTEMERVVLTEWHPALSLPTKITEPGKETIFTYDNQGWLLLRSSVKLP